MKTVNVYQIWDSTSDKVLITITGYKDKPIYEGFLKWCNNHQISPSDVHLIKIGCVNEPVTEAEYSTFEPVYFEDVYHDVYESAIFE